MAHVEEKQREKVMRVRPVRNGCHPLEVGLLEGKFPAERVKILLLEGFDEAGQAELVFRGEPHHSQ